MAKKEKRPRLGPKANDGDEPANEPSVAAELGRMAKLFALFLLKDVEDEGTKITRLNGVGFSAQEIAALLGKTVQNVRVQISQAKTKRGE